MADNTVLGLLILALIITLASTIVSVSKVIELNNVFDQITGALGSNTSIATTTLTVQSVTAVYNSISIIAFGSGYVHSTCSACGFDTFNGTRGNEGATTTNATCCVGFNNISYGFLLENVGNLNVTLNMSCTGHCNATEFLGNGTGIEFKFKVTNGSDTGSTNASRDTVTDTATSCGPTGWNYSDWTDMWNKGWNASHPPELMMFDLCGGSSTTKYWFGAENTKDAVVMDLKVKIPSDIATTAGAKTATITFKAESAG